MKRFPTPVLDHGDNGFTSPLREVLLWLSKALKNSSLSTGFEPMILGSNGKHDNHYTTENDKCTVKSNVIIKPQIQ
jgi:hypothetical protein